MVNSKALVKELANASKQKLDKLTTLLECINLFNKLILEFGPNTTKVVVLQGKLWTFDQLLIIGLQFCALSSYFKSIDCDELFRFLVLYGDRIRDLQEQNRIDCNLIAKENLRLT
jgi:hypothetical protein